MACHVQPLFPRTPPAAAVASRGASSRDIAAGPRIWDADTVPEHVRVAIIGAGFGGLGAGVRLRQAGMADFVILERAASVVGT